MLTPQEDYSTWALLFNESATEGGEYSLFLPDCNTLLSEILENDSLQGVLENHTEQFLNVNLPIFVRNILNIIYNCLSDRELVFDFLANVVSICVWAIDKDNKTLLELLGEVLDQNKDVYTIIGENDKKTTASEFCMIADLFFLAGGVDTYFERIEDLSNPAKLFHFYTLLQIVNPFTNDTDKIDMDEFFPRIFDDLMPFITKYSNDLRSFDSSDLGLVISLFVSLASKLNESSFVSFTPIYDFVYRCLKSEILEKQIFAIKFISNTSDVFGCNHLSDDLVNWMQGTDFIQYALTHDHHQEVLKNFSHIFRFIASHKLFTKEQMSAYWVKVNSSFYTLHNDMRTLACIILTGLSEEDVDSFIESLLNENPISPEVFTFLALVINSICSTHQNIVMKYIRRLIDMSDTCPEVNEFFSKFVGLSMSSDFKEEIINFCISLIYEKKDKTIPVSLLKRVIRVHTRATDEYKKELEEKLFKMLTKFRGIAFDILVMFFNNFKNKITKEELESIAKMGEDSFFWKFLSDMMKKKKEKAFDEETFAYIVNLIHSVDFRKDVSMEFVDYLFDYIKLQNCLAKKIIFSESQTFDIVSLPLLHADILFDLYLQTPSDEISDYTSSFLLFLYTSYTDITPTDIAKSVLPYVMPKEGYTKEKINRCIYFISSFVQNIESMAADSQKIELLIDRHCDNNDGMLHITLAGMGLSLKLWVQPDDHESALTEKLEVILENKYIVPYYYINERPYFSGTIQKALGDSRNIRVSHRTEEEFANFTFITPTKLLDEINFSSTIIKLLEDGFADEDIVKQLLEILPDDKGIIEKIKTPDVFFADIEKDTLKKYKMQVLVHQFYDGHDDNIQMYKNYTSTFVNMLLDGGKESDLLPELLWICANVCDDFGDDFENVVLFVFDLMIDNSESLSFYNNTNYINKLFINLNKYGKEEFEAVCYNNIDIFEGLLLYSDEIYEDAITEAISSFYTKQPIYDLVLPYIEDITKVGERSEFISSVFQLSISDIAKTGDVEDLLSKCIALTKKTSGPMQASILNVVSSIFATNKEIAQKNIPLIKKLLPAALNTDNDTILSPVLDITLNVVKSVPEATRDIVEIIVPYIKESISGWEMSPEKFVVPDHGLVGLRNLGATCYMNSVLQQLYFTFPLRKAIIEADFRGQEDKESIQRLFSELFLSKSKAIDTQPFASKFRGWGQQVINPREQQDAVEFLHMFVEQLPEKMQMLFKGETVSIMEGLTENYRSENTEPFYALQVSVKNMENLDEGFAELLEKEVFTDDNMIYSSELGHKIDAQKYSRIRIAPPILILQLNRFEYNLTTYERYKVSTRYEFKTHIDISNILEDPMPMEYELTGIVFHSGSAFSGHYFSAVKKDNTWYKFNDKEVTMELEYNIMQMAFGGGDSSYGSVDAYMLFYTKTEELKRFPTLGAITVPEKIRESIEKENKVVVAMKTLLSDPMCKFMGNCKVITVMLDYFFNILIHSDMEQKCHDFYLKIEEVVKSTNTLSIVQDYIFNKFDAILEAYKNCTNVNITGSVTSLVSDFARRFSIEKQVELYTKAITQLPQFVENWRTISTYQHLIGKFVEAVPDIAREKGIEKKILDSIIDFYNKTNSTQSLSSVILKDLFKALELMYRENKFDISALISLKKKVEHSKINSIWLRILLLITGREVDGLKIIKELVEALEKNSSDADQIFDILTIIIANSTPAVNQQIFDYVKQHLTYTFTISKIAIFILQSLRDGYKKLRESLIDSYKEIVYPLLIYPEYDCRIIALETTFEIIGGQSPPDYCVKYAVIYNKIPKEPFKFEYNENYTRKVVNFFSTTLLDNVKNAIPKMYEEDEKYANKRDTNGRLVLFTIAANWLFGVSRTFSELTYEKCSYILDKCYKMNKTADENVLALSSLIISYRFNFKENAIKYLPIAIKILESNITTLSYFYFVSKMCIVRINFMNCPEYLASDEILKFAYSPEGRAQQSREEVKNQLRFLFKDNMNIMSKVLESFHGKFIESLKNGDEKLLLILSYSDDIPDNYWDVVCKHFLNLVIFTSTETLIALNKVVKKRRSVNNSIEFDPEKFGKAVFNSFIHSVTAEATLMEFVHIVALSFPDKRHSIFSAMLREIRIIDNLFNARSGMNIALHFLSWFDDEENNMYGMEFFSLFIGENAVRNFYVMLLFDDLLTTLAKLNHGKNKWSGIVMNELVNHAEDDEELDEIMEFLFSFLKIADDEDVISFQNKVKSDCKDENIAKLFLDTVKEKRGDLVQK